MESTPLSARSERWLIVSIAFAAFISSLDGNIVAVALPDISRSLGVPIATVSLVIVAYLLFVTASLPLIGKLGTLFGARRMFLAGFGVFGVASLICALSRNINVLVAARILQAVGGAALLAIGYVLVAEHLRPERRGLAMGLLGGSASVASIIGAPVGGFMTQLWSWHSIFFINVPLCALAMLVSWSHIPPDAPASEAEKKAPFDWLGLLFITIGLLGFVHGLNDTTVWGWGSWETLATLGVGILFLAAFIWQEQRTPAPIIPGVVFRDAGAKLGMVCAAAVMMILGCLSVLGPFFLQEVHLLVPGTVGLLMTVPGVVMLVASPLAGWLADRIGAALLMLLASALLCVACAGLATLGMGSSLVHIGVVFAVCGLAIGLFFPPNSTFVMSRATPELRSVTASTYNIVKSVGMLLGISLLGTIGYAFVKHQFGTTPISDLNRREALALGFAAAMWASFALSVITTVAATAAWRRAAKP